MFNPTIKKEHECALCYTCMICVACLTSPLAIEGLINFAGMGYLF